METKNVNAHNSSAAQSERTAKKGNPAVLIIAVLLLVLAGIIFLFTQLDPVVTGKIRDVSIIVYVLESILTLAAVVVLLVQVSRLLNFLRLELKPILGTSLKTVKKVSGTVSFLCDNAVEPVIKTSSTVSGIKNAAAGVLSFFQK